MHACLSVKLRLTVYFILYLHMLNMFYLVLYVIKLKDIGFMCNLLHLAWQETTSGKYTQDFITFLYFKKNWRRMPFMNAMMPFCQQQAKLKMFICGVIILALWSQFEFEHIRFVDSSVVTYPTVPNSYVINSLSHNTYSNI